MTLGAPLLSITRNADEWLGYSNDNVTLLLSLTKNVFNGDTECYRNFVSHSPLILKLMVSLFSVVTAMMAELVVLGSVNLKPRRLSALRKWTVHGAS